MTDTTPTTIIEPQETALSVTSIDLEQVGALIRDMDEAIKKCAATAEELAIDDAALSAMDYKDVKRFEQEISREIKEAEEARKTFKRRWQEPQKAVESAFKAAIEDTTGLHARYKTERTRRDAADAQARYDELDDAYHAFLEDNGLSTLADNVPFERIFDKSWANRSTSAKKALDEMTERVSAIMADYRAVTEATYHYPDDAQRDFFECLSLREVVERDNARHERQQRLDALREQVETNREEVAPIEETAPVVKPATAPEPTPEEMYEYTFTVRCTDAVFQQLRTTLDTMPIVKLGCKRKAIHND